MKPTTLPSFVKPPLIEVVMGIQYSNPILRNNIDVSDIYTGLGRTNFPIYSEQAPLNPAGDPMSNNNVILFEFNNAPEMPRHWFENQDKSSLVQIQRDRFIYNWRRPMDKPPTCYPRFGAVYEAFDRNYQIFATILGEKGINTDVPKIVELTYVNAIDVPKNGMYDLGAVFKNLSGTLGQSETKKPRGFNLLFESVLDKLSSVMSIQVFPVKNIANGENKIQCQITVRGPLMGSDRAALKGWFVRAREEIVTTFADITQPEMHTLWERQA